MWHRVAPALAEHHTVIATDLRGYGASGKPASTPDHAPYSMRQLATDQLEVMRALGHDRFAVAGHDRGARCAYRLALDHPQAVDRLAVLDIVPTGDTFRGADMEFSLGFWIWSFLAAPYPVPEQLIAKSPATLVDHMLDSWADVQDVFSAEIRQVYIDNFASPERVHAICEQYRAAATLDFEHDEADRGARKIQCPVLALWSDSGAVAARYEPLDVWKQWAEDVHGGAVHSGHFIPEEAPEVTIDEFVRFFG